VKSYLAQGKLGGRRGAGGEEGLSRVTENI